MADKIELLIKISVDPDKFDLREWTDDAIWAGWGDDPENGLWYLAEGICDAHAERGLSLEVVV